MAFDPCEEVIYAAVNSEVWGPVIYTSSNFGEDWKQLKNSPRFSKQSKLKVEKIWHLAPDPLDQRRVYAGVAPAALFFTEDEGESWREVESLNRHASRKLWQPGAGGLCLHTVVFHPSEKRRIWVAISAAGVFRTEDRGETWQPTNRGTRADFLPEKYPRVGQCVHKLVISRGTRGVLYQQNHCGVYKSSSYGEDWIDISKGLPSRFGFPIAVHPRDPSTIYVVPEESQESHIVVKGKFAVYRSKNRGGKWESLHNGLPKRNAYLSVLRESLALDQNDPCGLYVGTNTGQIFYSVDEGYSWGILADYLPPIYSVNSITLT